MTLLLRQSEIASLFQEPTSIEESFEVITRALVASEGAETEHTSWLAYPLGNSPNAKVHINILASSSGTSLRLFPPPAGPTVKTGDSLAVLLDEAGRVVALMDLHAVGSWRTSGVAAVASRALAPAGARVAALVGSGTEARYFLQALRVALPGLEQVRVYSPTPENRERFAREMTGDKLAVQAVSDARQAVEGADLVYVSAASREPVLEADWVKPGGLVVNITQMGVPFDFPARRIIPDRRMPELRSSGWDPWPVGGNWNKPGQEVTTLADVLRGAPVRHHPQERLIYTQLGVFAWDAPLMAWVYESATKRGLGTSFQFAQ